MLPKLNDCLILSLSPELYFSFMNTDENLIFKLSSPDTFIIQSIMIPKLNNFEYKITNIAINDHMFYDGVIPIYQNNLLKDLNIDKLIINNLSMQITITYPGKLIYILPVFTHIQKIQQSNIYDELNLMDSKPIDGLPSGI
jgi:hypothetical protein